jgi:hypothetical protein
MKCGALDEGVKKMRHGVSRSISLVAISAAAGLAVAATGAQAADLGGNCCADLEERVAELEATVARKGNRKVSLRIYGQVSESIVWWNDGAEKNVYVVENYLNKNRLGFDGNAKINTDWSAGYQIELGIRAYRSSNASQLALGASNGVSIPAYNTQSVALRQANWWIQSNAWGRITVGRTNDAASGTSSVNLASPDGFSGITGPGYINNGFFIRRAGTTGNGGLSGLTWGDTANFRNGDGPASMSYAESAAQVKYTSPFFLGQTKSSGFRLDASVGMDDFWAVGLRYAEDLGQFRFAAAASYSKWTGVDRGMCTNGGSTGDITTVAGVSNTDCDAIQGSASLMHKPTGLYITGQAGQIANNGANALLALTTASTGLAAGALRAGGVDTKHSIWGVQAGWQAKLNSLGNTTFWGQMVKYDTGLGVRNSVVQTVATTDAINSLGAGQTGLIAGSQTTYWGGGISQEITAASMILFAGYHVGSTELVLQNRSATATVQRQKSNAIDDFQMLYSGATLRF